MYLHTVVRMPELADQVVRIAAPALAILLLSRKVLDFRTVLPMASILAGAAVFALWIASDLLFPGYRRSGLFENALFGAARSSLSPEARSNTAILTLRTMRAVLIVPMAEELFWRGWLMRWLISPAFQKVPLGAYQTAAFWLCALLFASEHGPYWEVGLVAGVAFNWWMVRTRSLGDLILCHAVANACLSLYVIAAGKWEYWL